MHRLPLRLVAFLAVCVASPGTRLAAQHPVCTTTADLAALCRAVGGDKVAVTCLTRPGDDPHFVEARPSMIRAVHGTELLACIGRELEVGWLPLLCEQGRNPAVQPGGPGLFVASDFVRALGVPATPVDRSQGDVHAGGNPHFLTDPLCGLQVANALCARFSERWPDERDCFVANRTAFEHALAAALVGEELAKAYGHEAEKLLVLLGAGRLDAVLRQQGDIARLGGIAAVALPLRATKVVADHDIWPYFAERFGLDVVACFEPNPGIPPTSRHLQKVVAAMQARDVHVILSTPYFAPRHAEFVSTATGACIARLAHQPGAQPGTDDYLAFVANNVRSVSDALAAASAEKPR